MMCSSSIAPSGTVTAAPAGAVVFAVADDWTRSEPRPNHHALATPPATTTVAPIKAHVGRPRLEGGAAAGAAGDGSMRVNLGTYVPAGSEICTPSVRASFS